MKKASFVKVMMLACILPLSAFMEDDLTNPTQEQVIDLTNDNESLSNTETLQVPVTATVSNNLLNVSSQATYPQLLYRYRTRSQARLSTDRR